MICQLQSAKSRQIFAIYFLYFRQSILFCEYMVWVPSLAQTILIYHYDLQGIFLQFILNSEIPQVIELTAA